jgi:hypothetical protein
MKASHSAVRHCDGNPVSNYNSPPKHPGNGHPATMQSPRQQVSLPTGTNCIPVCQHPGSGGSEDPDSSVTVRRVRAGSCCPVALSPTTCNSPRAHCLQSRLSHTQSVRVSPSLRLLRPQMISLSHKQEGVSGLGGGGLRQSGKY